MSKLLADYIEFRLLMQVKDVREEKYRSCPKGRRHFPNTIEAVSKEIHLATCFDNGFLGIARQFKF
jgi:hypothetical protein